MKIFQIKIDLMLIEQTINNNFAGKSIAIHVAKLEVAWNSAKQGDEEKNI